MYSKERAFALLMSSLKTYIEDYIEQKIEEIANRVLNKLKQDEKGNQKTVGLPLKEWISTEHNENDIWEPVVLPYIAAYLAGEEKRLTHKQFLNKFGVNIPSSTYSDWTKNYFARTAVNNINIYNRERLVHWWKRMNIPEEERSEIIENLKERNLL